MNHTPYSSELTNNVTKLVTKGLEKFMEKRDIVAFVGDLVIELEKIIARRDRTGAAILHSPLDNHFRGVTDERRKFVYCPVGRICSWHPGDYDNEWCHWCKIFYMTEKRQTLE